MKKLICLIPLFLLGCAFTSVSKIGDNLYAVSEKSEPTIAAAQLIPDPAIDDIKNAANDHCKKSGQKVKVVTYDKPLDPTIRQGMFEMTFSCVSDAN